MAEAAALRELALATLKRSARAAEEELEEGEVRLAAAASSAPRARPPARPRPL